MSNRKNTVKQGHNEVYGIRDQRAFLAVGSGITVPGSGITTRGIGVSIVFVESGIKVFNVLGIRDQTFNNVFRIRDQNFGQKYGIICEKIYLVTTLC